MDIRIVKLSNNKGEADHMTSRDILDIHEGASQRNDMVTFSTGLPIARKPDFVILVCGNTSDYAYFEVEEYEYQTKNKFIPQSLIFAEYSPDKYRNEPNVSWMVLRRMASLENILKKSTTTVK